jgi:hypothetical protein
MLYSALSYAGDLSVLGFVALLAGAPVYWWSSRGPSVGDVTSGAS